MILPLEYIATVFPLLVLRPGIFCEFENIPDSNYFPSPNFFGGGVYYLTYYLIFAGQTLS